MPMFQLYTNVAEIKITKEFLKSTVKVVADTLGKPSNRVVVHVQPDQRIQVGDTDGLCGIVSVTSIGNLSPEENKKHSAVICGHLNKTLGIPVDRVKIHFQNFSATDVGTNNTTFHYILGGT